MKYVFWNYDLMPFILGGEEEARKAIIAQEKEYVDERNKLAAFLI